MLNTISYSPTERVALQETTNEQFKYLDRHAAIQNQCLQPAPPHRRRGTKTAALPLDGGAQPRDGQPGGADADSECHHGKRIRVLSAREEPPQRNRTFFKVKFKTDFK